MSVNKKIADLEREVQGLQEKYDRILLRLDSGFDFARWMAHDQAEMCFRESEHLVEGQKPGAYGGSLNRATGQRDGLSRCKTFNIKRF